MNTTVKTIALNYQNLAQKTISLERSYRDLSNLYNEVIIEPRILIELEKQGASPLKVLESMVRDREKLLSQFLQLADLIASASANFTQDPEATELEAITHDRQVMQDLVTSLDLSELQQMFDSAI